MVFIVNSLRRMPFQLELVQEGSFLWKVVEQISQSGPGWHRMLRLDTELLSTLFPYRNKMTKIAT